MADDYTCFKCGTSITTTSRIGFRETCTKCTTDLHCCKNCTFYDIKSYNDCRETSAERVVDKDRYNRCDYFSFASKSGKNTLTEQKDATKKKLDDLFK